MGCGVSKAPVITPDSTPLLMHQASVKDYEAVGRLLLNTPDQGLSAVRTARKNLMSTTDFTSKKARDWIKILYSAFRAFAAQSTILNEKGKQCVDKIQSPKVVDIITRILRKHGKRSLHAASSRYKESVDYYLSRLGIDLLMMITSRNRKCCEHVVKKRFYEYLFSLLDDGALRPENNHNYDAKDEGQYTMIRALFSGIGAILLNCIQHMDLRKSYRKCDAVRIWNMYRNVKQPWAVFTAELNFAFVVTEQEKDLMRLTDESVQCFCELLLIVEPGLLSVVVKVDEDGRSCKSESSSFGGTSTYKKHLNLNTEKVIHAINQLAVNDDNKVTIAKSELMTWFVAILERETSTASELVVTTKAIWLLAFKAKEDILANEKCLDVLERLSNQGGTKEIKDNARGALWLLGQENFTKTTDNNGGHIMISYEWATKPTMLRVRDKLQQAGYKVWMDVDNMTGSLLDAMADAVENASIVIIGLTEKYKESPNCRMECEYASKRRKPIIPLLLQHRYDADGWLGIIKGTKLHFDFSVEEKFAASLQGLLKEIATTAKTVVNVTPGDNDQGAASSSDKAKPVAANCIDRWSTQEVADWLKEKDLQQLIDRFPSLDGGGLMEYKHLMVEDPRFFNKSMKKVYRIAHHDIMTFRRALRQL